MSASPVPVVTIDGPSGTGKGTLGRHLAAKLGWRFLDSGALYRLVALAARQRNIPLDDADALGLLARNLDVVFVPSTGGAGVQLDGEEVGGLIRTEDCGNAASAVAALPAVREALLERQRAFRRAPGLVADGRDMGTVVFPDAVLKLFLDASPQERARRRHKQLMEKGISVNLAQLVTEIAERDRRDRERCASPLRPAADAVIIDSTHLGIESVFEQVLTLVRLRLPGVPDRV